MTLWTWEQERLYSLYFSSGNMLSSWHDFMDFRARAAIQFMILQCMVETCCPHDFIDVRARAAIQFMILQCMVETCCPHDFIDVRARAAIQFMIIQCMVETCCPHDFMDFRARAAIQFMILQCMVEICWHILMTLWTLEQERLYSLWYFSGGYMLSSWLYGL